MTVNNGARIVVTNLDIGKFVVDSYSVHGMEGSTDPPAVNAGSLTLEILSGDPAKNICIALISILCSSRNWCYSGSVVSN